MSPDLNGRADAGGGGSPIQAEERALLAVFDATSSAWAEGDANAFVRWYGENAAVILPGVYLKGKAAVRAGMADAFAMPLKDSKRIHTAQDVRFLDADTAIVITRSVTVFPGEPEPPADRWELATWAFSRGDDGWLVEAYHSCPAGTAI
ncbi:SgcJ/EcaC family oxidoreductase [Nonomuraea sp. NPDC049784]|uniref:SgcJ/EcaC family oxidoreductase n=1 Tax=Nonomuraea sp. NPDC049784 TaxID=3154361 RepID=UPI0033F2EBFC